jgi:hypothetical protein
MVRSLTASDKAHPMACDGWRWSMRQWQDSGVDGILVRAFHDNRRFAGFSIHQMSIR